MWENNFLSVLATITCEIFSGLLFRSLNVSPFIADGIFNDD